MFNASQMHKYRLVNDLRQPFQQKEGQINMKQITNSIWKKSDIQGQQGDQLRNNDILSDKQNINNEQVEGRYFQDKNGRGDVDLKQKFKDGSKRMEYKENEPVEKLQQNNNGKTLHEPSFYVCYIFPLDIIKNDPVYLLALFVCYLITRSDR